MMKSILVFFGVLIVLGVTIFTGCTTKPVTMDDIQEKSSKKKSKEPSEKPTEELPKEPTESAASDWKNIELRDVRTGKKFKISDFKGKPILLESFAVWCPTCKKQQDEVKKLHEQIGDSVISVSVDTDPGEDKAKVLEHIERYGYQWLFAIDQGGFAKKLVDEFGVNVVNAPSAPVVLICEDQKARLLRFGVKSAKDLKREIDKDCE